jgi:thioredoxin-like negative regulator of GroEL
MRPRWQAVFAKHPEIKIFDFDFDDNQTEAVNYKITRVPEVLIINADNQEVKRLTGMKDAQEIEEVLKNFFTN